MTEFWQWALSRKKEPIGELAAHICKKTPEPTIAEMQEYMKENGSAIGQQVLENAILRYKGTVIKQELKAIAKDLANLADHYTYYNLFDEHDTVICILRQLTRVVREIEG